MLLFFLTLLKKQFKMKKYKSYANIFEISPHPLPLPLPNGRQAMGRGEG
jgi:hypothetical protein